MKTNYTKEIQNTQEEIDFLTKLLVPLQEEQKRDELQLETQKDKVDSLTESLKGLNKEYVDQAKNLSKSIPTAGVDESIFPKKPQIDIHVKF